MIEEKFISKEVVMNTLNIKQTTLYKYIRLGWIKRYKFGKKTMFLESDLAKIIEDIKKGKYDTSISAKDTPPKQS